MAMDGGPVGLESRQILPRMTSSDSVRVQVISSSASHRAAYISGGVLGGVGLLTLIVLLIHLVRQYQKEAHGPLITPIYPTSPVSTYSCSHSHHVLHSPSPSLSTPSLTPQRMNSMDSLRRFSTHKPPVASSPSITFTDLGNLPAQGAPLMAIPEMSSPVMPSLPAQTYAGIYRPPVPPSSGSSAVNPSQPARTSFLSRSSTRITSFLPRYQRSYVPSYPEDIPPAYHG